MGVLLAHHSHHKDHEAHQHHRRESQNDEVLQQDVHKVQEVHKDQQAQHLHHRSQSQSDGDQWHQVHGDLRKDQLWDHRIMNPILQSLKDRLGRLGNHRNQATLRVHPSSQILIP